MLCKLCNQFFVCETTFRNLYRFEEICINCQKTYAPSIHHESIPMTNGLIEYYYLYDQVSLNMKQRLYLHQYCGMLFQIIKSQASTPQTVIFVDRDFIFSFKREFAYMKRFNRITFLSVFRYDFSHLQIFF